MSMTSRIFSDSETVAKRLIVVLFVLFVIVGSFAYGASTTSRSTILVSTTSHYSAESYEWLWDLWINETVAVPENPVIASLRVKCDAGVDVQLNISQNSGAHYVDFFNWTALVVAWGVPAGDGGWYSIGLENCVIYRDPVLDNEPAYTDPFSYEYSPLNSDYSITNEFEIIVVMFGSVTEHVGDPWMHHEWYITTWRG